MNGGEVFIPITMFLMTGIVLVSWIYYRSKEKQMMIDKGMSYEQMVEFLKTKRNPYTVLKMGIVIAVSGFGIGIGSYIGENYQHEGMGGIAALFIIVFIGLGFITAFYATKKYEVDNKQ
ncbi:MAG: hypothetical protein F9K45_01730 [Melioribacteraceae bacterium]|nr:MAG: hypothetical protein F9K45_01730 [Melioribacteraceae bacterium]